MKKIISLSLLLFSFTFAQAQITQYRTIKFAQASVYNGNYTWGDWERSNMDVYINWAALTMIIKSPSPQCYSFSENMSSYTDNQGAEIFRTFAVDQDGDRCHIRFRINKREGYCQIYIDFNNVAWVYSVAKVRELQ